MNDDLNVWMKLQSWVGMASSIIVLFLGVVAFIRNKNVGWLLLSAWCFFSLIAGITAMYILPGQPGMVFAISGVVASALLVLAICLLAFPKSTKADRETNR